MVCGYIYADAGNGESTTDMVFAGHNLIGENGSILAEGKLFQNGIVCSEIDVDKLMGERRRMNTFPAEQAEDYRMIDFELEPEQTMLSRKIDMRP